MKKILIENKRGIGKDYLLAFILGLIVVAILLSFIFKEYFSKDDISYETCRQSVILRANSPEISDPLLGIQIVDIKEKFPLKCETNIVNIDFKDKEKAEKIIAETFAQCWYLFGEGKTTLFPGGEGESLNSYCVPCARIHFDRKVRDFYSLEENIINVRSSLEQKLTNTKITTGDYLKNAFGAFVGSTDTFGVIMFENGESASYKIQGDKFFIKEFSGTIGTFFNVGVDIGSVTLPNYIKSSNGDVLIFFQQIRFKKNDVTSSSLLYFQAEQNNPDPFEQISSVDFIERERQRTSICKGFDGIPV